MTGAKWNSVKYDGKNYDLSHLHPFSFPVEVAGTQVVISVSFGNHVFTDQKENGPELFAGRYFCKERYASSLALPKMLVTRLIDSHVVPHVNHKNNEVYYYCETHDYAIFFDLRQNGDELKLVVISAYEADKWGKAGLPRGTPVKFSRIAHLRLQGKTYFTEKKTAKRRY